MAVYLKTLFIVILTLDVRQVYSMPVEKDLLTLKDVSDIVTSDLEDMKFVRIKRSLMVVGTCPEGMQFYKYRCWTTEEYNRLINQDYDNVAITDAVSVTYYKTTHEDKHGNTIAVATDPTSNTEYAALDVIPLPRHKQSHANENEVKTAVNSRDHDGHTSDKQHKDTITINKFSNTEKLVNIQTMASTTVPRSVHDQTMTSTTARTAENVNNNAGVRRVRLTVEVISISCCSVAMIWFFYLLYQCHRRSNEHVRDSSIVASSTEDIPATHASEHDRFLTCNTNQ